MGKLGWLNHGNPSRGTKTCQFLCEILFWALADSMHRNVHRKVHGHLRVMGLDQETLSGVLGMKDGLDRTGMKIQTKMARISCILMCPWMHFLDLQGLYMFWTTWINDCIPTRQHFQCFTLLHSEWKCKWGGYVNNWCGQCYTIP